ncbi:HD domain-containing protein [Clostridium cellulovorans]|uniref:Metal dependent phophohydrolase n=1 Tax=Clostridium cellulovorans (strain ATCC 35296 / DSM 3052 / OCM 3 / 743B) TaxID=573061 RepID=D9SKX5_CLOC7|nr:HD domain-containing protein [Clostridium cellulovorans]ADL53547.1 metal dependent phophohydrolase [Clostridium cellulovorans 743B]
MANDNLFYEVEKHLLEDEVPSKYLSEIIKADKMKESPFNLISELAKAEQNPQYHPEGNALIHTLMVVDNAAKVREKSSDRRVLMWASLLHDIGKGPTTRLKKGRWTAYDHDKVGKDLTIKFLESFNLEQEFITKVAAMVRWHMQTLFVMKKLPFQELEQMVKEVEIDEIALLSFCDRTGRTKMTKEDINKTEETIEQFKKEARKHLRTSSREYQYT